MAEGFEPRMAEGFEPRMAKGFEPRVYTRRSGTRDMRIRDALESDAEAIAEVTGRPPDVVVDTIHDRSVRVAVRGEDREAEGTVDGFVAFDVRSETVHVTDFGGSKTAIGRLFDEPKRFGDRERMDVEVVVAGENEDRIEAVEAAGFVAVGAGPRFDGRETVRFRLEIDDGNEGN